MSTLRVFLKGDVGYKYKDINKDITINYSYVYSFTFVITHT